MGFYIRKAIKVGPLRFNLSKSGVGVSAGIKGLRFGTGPRGNYVHMGRGGLYYRQSLGNSRSPNTPSPVRETGHAYSVDPTLGPMIDIESGPVSHMVDSSAADLLAEMNAKKHRARFAGWVAAASLVILASSVSAGDRPVQTIVASAVCIGLVWYVHQRDVLRKSTVLFYDFADGAESRFQGIHDAFGTLAEAQRAWHVESHAAVYDKRYHAGASDSIRRTVIRPTIGLPPGIRVNVDIPMLKVGQQLLAFMPERVLVFDDGQVGAIAYQDILAEVSTTRFIESEGAPSDSQVVGRTWRFVNKDGSPDRRFNNNRELPIRQYEALRLTSQSGLNELIHLSKTGSSRPLALAII